MSALAPDRLAGLLRQALAQDKTVFLQVSSGSMAPLLRAGDQIEVLDCPAADWLVGADGRIELILENEGP